MSDLLEQVELVPELFREVLSVQRSAPPAPPRECMACRTEVPTTFSVECRADELISAFVAVTLCTPCLHSREMLRNNTLYLDLAAKAEAGA